MRVGACARLPNVIGRWLLIAETPVHFRGLHVGFVVDESVTGTVFLLRLFGLSLLIVPLLRRTDLSHCVVILAGSTGPDVWLVSD
jgi:hypothetical protein